MKRANEFVPLLFGRLKIPLKFKQFRIFHFPVERTQIPSKVAWDI